MTYYGNAHIYAGLNEATGRATLGLTASFSAGTQAVAYWLRRRYGRGHSRYKRGL